MKWVGKDSQPHPLSLSRHRTQSPAATAGPAWQEHRSNVPDDLSQGYRVTVDGAHFQGPIRRQGRSTDRGAGQDSVH